MYRHNSERQRYRGGRYVSRDSERQWLKDHERYERAEREHSAYVSKKEQVEEPQANTESVGDKSAEKETGEKSTNITTKEEVSKENQKIEELKKLQRLKKWEARKKMQDAKKKGMEIHADNEVASFKRGASQLSHASPPKKKISLVSSRVQMKPNTVINNPLKINRLFEDSDDEAESSKKSFFKPIKESSTHKASNNDRDSELESDSEPSHSNAIVDSLDAFMNEIKEGDVPSDVEMNDSTDQALLEEGSDVEQKSLIDQIGTDNEADQLLKKLKNKKTKIIQSSSYHLKNLEPFPKNFLVEVESMDPDEVINFRVLNSIFISNKKIKPVMNFYHFGLDAETLGTIITDFRYEKPTPIQSQTIPSIMSGKDVIGIGRTGSGKTMCYLLGLLKHVKQQRPLSDSDTGPLAIVLSPTRELATQIYDTLQIFLKSTKLRAICCTGGSELNKQINVIKKGVEIVVATPGRFIDLLTLNGGKLLKTTRITFVTLDEADRLFDLGFEPQINQIMKTIRPDKQCVLFSATFPTKLQDFAVKLLNKPIIIAVGNKQVVNENIKQEGKLFENEDDKFNYLLHLLGKQGERKTIIFCESQIQVNFMNKRLVDKGYSPVSIHAGLPAYERSSNLSDFRKSSNILICTEVLSRGLDVPEVNLVILYNAARTFAQYVHTTGRTARGNTKGSAVSLLSKDEDLQAYILYKCMPEEDVPENIKNLAFEFEKELKAGKKKITAGFGGKGLDHLEKLRDENEKNERKKYGEEEETKMKKIVNSDGEEEEEEDHDSNGNEPNIDIVYNTWEHGRAPDSGKFNAKINVNDLPQNVRWLATNNTTLSKIIDQTSASVTYKGRYYPEGKEPKEKEEPKLYLLVEAEKEIQLVEAVDLFKKVIIEGLKKAHTQQERTGKFTI